MAVLIDPKDAYLHVTYDFRCLVRAEYAYRLGMKDASVGETVPEITTVARNAVLAKARSLVDFYTKPSPRNTDITFNEYFGGSLQATDATLFAKLTGVRASMEVHDLHLTAWRDPAYRSSNADPERQRIDWNAEQSNIVDNLLEALRVSSTSLSAEWQKAFLHLHTTSINALQNGSGWEKDISDETETANYLHSLGL
jgi:hypothetical protein